MEAIKWYCKAAILGHPSAQSNLGLLYANGEGVDKDPIVYNESGLQKRPKAMEYCRIL